MPDVPIVCRGDPSPEFQARRLWFIVELAHDSASIKGPVRLKMELPPLLGDGEDAALEEALAFLDSCDFVSLEAPLVEREGELVPSWNIDVAVTDSMSRHPVSPVSRTDLTSISTHPGTAAVTPVNAPNIGGAMKQAVHAQQQQHCSHWEARSRQDHRPTQGWESLATANTYNCHSVVMSPQHAQPRRRRQSPREQLIQLREIVYNLEVQLESLQGHAKSLTNGQVNAEHKTKALGSVIPRESGDETGVPNAGAPTDAYGEARAMWRHIATQQYSERCKAERENAELKQRLEVQIAEARRLEVLLERQHGEGV